MYQMCLKKHEYVNYEFLKKKERKRERSMGNIKLWNK